MACFSCTVVFQSLAKDHCESRCSILEEPNACRAARRKELARQLRHRVQASVVDEDGWKLPVCSCLPIGRPLPA